MKKNEDVLEITRLNHIERRKIKLTLPLVKVDTVGQYNTLKKVLTSVGYTWDDQITFNPSMYVQVSQEIRYAPSLPDFDEGPKTWKLMDYSHFMKKYFPKVTKKSEGLERFGRMLGALVDGKKKKKVAQPAFTEESLDNEVERLKRMLGI